MTQEKWVFLIVDDEPFAREILETFVGKIPGAQLAASCSSAFEAADVLQKTMVDILITDIQMPQINGIELIKSLKHPPAVIISTAHSDYAVEGFELGVVDYLLKPTSFERFSKAVNKAKEQINNKSQATKTEERKYYYFKDGSKLVKILFDEILYVEGLKDYIKIVTKEKNYVVYMRMRDAEELLPTSQFFRIHRSYIINIAEIKEIIGNFILMSNLVEVAFAQSARSALFARLGIKKE